MVSDSIVQIWGRSDYYGGGLNSDNQTDLQIIIIVLTSRSSGVRTEQQRPGQSGHIEIIHGL